MQDKVTTCLQTGTRLVWVVRPKRRAVTVHYPDGAARTIGAKGTLSGEDVLPEFTLPLSELFA